MHAIIAVRRLEEGGCAAYTHLVDFEANANGMIELPADTETGAGADPGRAPTMERPNG
jgi:hypothetical protein